MRLIKRIFLMSAFFLSLLLTITGVIAIVNKHELSSFIYTGVCTLLSIFFGIRILKFMKKDKLFNDYLKRNTSHQQK